MKKLIIATCILACLHVQCIASLKKVTALPTSNDTIQLELVASFNFGSPGDCPELTSIDTFHNGNTVILKAYYDISGIWSANFCQSVDTVSLDILPTNFKKIEIEMYAIQYSPSDSDTTFTAPIWTIFLPLATGNIDKDPTEINIYPNPTKKTVTITAANTIEKIELTNLLGQQLILQQGNSTTMSINLESLASGIYIIKVNDSYVERVVKE